MSIDEKRAGSKWFGEGANWYVLFVKTNAEKRVVEHLKRKLNGDDYWVVVPTRDYNFRQRGKVITKHIPWLTGYVFVIGLKNSEECVGAINSAVEKDHNFYKMLSADGSVKGSELPAKDKDMMMSLFDENFNVATVKAIREGDMVRLLGDAFRGLLAKVEKVNHQKQTAQVRLKLFQEEVKVEIAYELTDAKDEIVVRARENNNEGNGKNGN